MTEPKNGEKENGVGIEMKPGTTAPVPAQEQGYISSWFFSPCQNVVEAGEAPGALQTGKMNARLEEEAHPAPGITVQSRDDSNFTVYPVENVRPPPPRNTL